MIIPPLPPIEWDTRALAKVDQASYAWRNARDRGNWRRCRYWNRLMLYWAGRAVGMSAKSARANLAEELAYFTPYAH